MRSPPTRITTYRAFAGDEPLSHRLRARARDAAILGLSRLRSGPSRAGARWIRFPYYHHVFDDERADFAAQLRWLRGFGEFISIDDALACLESPTPPDGRYYCITFDDGLANCLTNAAPILTDFKAPAAFFVPTRYIGTSIERDQALLATHQGGSAYVEYLDWEGCRRLVAAGMTIGSHTVSHARLVELEASAVERELRESKETIERELGVPCPHFCCPFGRPGLDFTPGREPEIARRLGYRSFLTTHRGKNDEKPSPLFVTRDHVRAGWGLYQLRYFFSS